MRRSNQELSAYQTIAALSNTLSQDCNRLEIIAQILNSDEPDLNSEDKQILVNMGITLSQQELDRAINASSE